MTNQLFQIKPISQNNGFTLLELIVTIGIAAILASIALPSFNNQIKNSRLVSNANLIVGAINLARSEAVARDTNVVIRNIANGWEIAQVAPAVVIKSFTPDLKGLTFTPATFPTLTFNSSGFRPLADNAALTISFCDDRTKGRTISVSPSGLTEVTRVCT